jgi:nucleotide-binding universal stress UspA family protein
VSESPAATTVPGPAEIAALERRMREAARAVGAEATIEVAAKPQVASTTILEVARRRRAELIVMGSHARRGIERLLLGSVAAHVARRAECPVTTLYHPYAAPVPSGNR